MIGSAHIKIGGARLVTGAGEFVADVRVAGMLQAAVFRSRHAHARLVSIDVKRALETPGVRAILTAADVPTPCTRASTTTRRVSSCPAR